MQYPLEHLDLWYGNCDYASNGGRLIYVSPKTFIVNVRPLDIDGSSRDNIDYLKQHILDGGKLDPLTMQANGREDGRHRAYAALELGIELVPVISYIPASKITKLPKAGYRAYILDAFGECVKSVTMLKTLERTEQWIADNLPKNSSNNTH